MRYLIEPQMTVLIKELNTGFQGDVTSRLERRLAVFIVFIILMLILFVVVWLPFINNLSREVVKTKKILLIIPLELLAHMKSVTKLISRSVFKKRKK